AHLRLEVEAAPCLGRAQREHRASEGVAAVEQHVARLDVEQQAIRVEVGLTALYAAVEHHHVLFGEVLERAGRHRQTFARQPQVATGAEDAVNEVDVHALGLEATELAGDDDTRGVDVLTLDVLDEGGFHLDVGERVVDSPTVRQRREAGRDVEDLPTV